MVRATIRPGRPPKDQVEALGDHVIEVADGLFIEKGFSGTSMAMVAARARIGKQTLYRRYPDKAALFREVIRRRIDRLVPGLNAQPAGGDPVEMLKRLSRGALNSVLDPTFISLYRIVISEGAQFPELAEAAANYWGSGIMERCIAAVKQAQAAGTFKPGNPERMGESILWALVGDPFYRVLSRQVLLTSEIERRRHFETTWRFFLEGVAARSEGRGKKAR